MGSPTEADQKDQAETEPSSSDLQEADQSEPAAEDKQPTAPDKGAARPYPPVYVVPGNGSVTIVCDDPEALEQFESLIRTLAPKTNYAGRNISIFELKNASATVVAEKLQDLVSGGRFALRTTYGSVAIVPDERLNTILVQGNRSDREMIEGLIKVFDSDEVPEALASNKPKLIPIENVDAEQVAEVIREVFRSQLTPQSRSSSRNGQTSSTRIVPQVAVDKGTNSLVVMAGSPLIEEITQLAKVLDEAAAENPARRIKIIPLDKVNATRMQEALEKIIKPSSRRSR